MEREADENRRDRRRHMARMRKAVDKILAQNENRMPNKQQRDVLVELDGPTKSEQKRVVTEEMLKSRQAKIEVFEERAQRLVDRMRVSDITQVPQRSARHSFPKAFFFPECTEVTHGRLPSPLPMLSD